MSGIVDVTYAKFARRLLTTCPSRSDPRPTQAPGNCLVSFKNGHAAFGGPQAVSGLEEFEGS